MKMAQFFNFKQDFVGLTENEADEKIKLYGLNVYTKNTKRQRKFSYSEVFLSPSVLMMFAAGVLCFFGMGIGAGIVTILIDAAYCFCEIYFRKAADKRLAELRESTLTKYRVIRNGALNMIEKQYIVPEDLIVVQAGERVPADAFILEARDLSCDESVLTGSTKPAAKHSGAISKNELKPAFVYAGTTVLTGIAVCRVSATGVDTKLYQRIGEVPERHPYFTGFERIIRLVVPICAGVAVLIALVSIAVRVFAGEDMLLAAFNAFSLGVCLIPTGISSIIRYYYTKGSEQLVKCGAVVKSLNDIEKLNSLSVLCVEKEGAISKNRLEVRGIYAKSEELLYKVAALACGQNTTDPAERALMVKATFFDENIADVYSENKFIENLADSGDTISGALWEVGGDRIYCIKGAPEQILPMCKLSGDVLLAAQKRYQDYYASGCTVLAFACVDASSGGLDKTIGFSYTFVGFAAFSAPLRDSVSTAVKTCRSAGVRVVMLTEENPGTAVSTGKMIGIPSDRVVTGSEIDDIRKNDKDFDCSANIYAKISSEQKLYVIDKFRKSGEVVAMTGTRPTDAEILRAANIGITIASHSAGSAFEAADIVMNDDNFLSIAQTISCARQIHRNIKRAVSLLISCYVGLIVLILFNLIFSGSVILTPPLAALSTMLLIPFLSLGYSGGKADMEFGMPPSEFVAERKLNFRFIGKSLIIGAVSGLVAAGCFALNSANYSNGISCALASYFFCIAAFAVLGQSDDLPFRTMKNASFTAKAGLSAALLAPILLCYIPFVNTSFGLYPISFLALIVSVLTGVFPAIVYYFFKRFIKIR